jgi:hypothetical protein
MDMECGENWRRIVYVFGILVYSVTINLEIYYQLPYEASRQLATSFILVSCLSYSSILKMEVTCSSETWVDYSGLHGVMSQRTRLFHVPV